MIEVFKSLAEDPEKSNLKLILTDLYPDQRLISKINESGISHLSYRPTPVDATHVNPELKGVRTMVGSFHHMNPGKARQILENAQHNKAPICIYEISDNRHPTALWWISIPIIFLMALVITPLVRPLAWKQIVFTYIIPVIPFIFAWDGAVSNVRTYTLEDLDVLLEGLESEEYRWEKGRISNRGNKLYLLGIPAG
jgi:hypothetical protein